MVDFADEEETSVGEKINPILVLSTPEGFGPVASGFFANSTAKNGQQSLMVVSKNKLLQLKRPAKTDPKVLANANL